MGLRKSLIYIQNNILLLLSLPTFLSLSEHLRITLWGSRRKSLARWPVAQGIKPSISTFALSSWGQRPPGASFSKTRVSAWPDEGRIFHLLCSHWTLWEARKFFNPPKEKELTRAGAKIFSKFKKSLLFYEESGWPGASSSDLTSQPGGWGLPFLSSPHSQVERQQAYSGFFRKAHLWVHLFVWQPETNKSLGPSGLSCFTCEMAMLVPLPLLDQFWPGGLLLHLQLSGLGLDNVSPLFQMGTPGCRIYSSAVIRNTFEFCFGICLWAWAHSFNILSDKQSSSF